MGQMAIILFYYLFFKIYVKIKGTFFEKKINETLDEEKILEGETRKNLNQRETGTPPNKKKGKER